MNPAIPPRCVLSSKGMYKYASLSGPYVSHPQCDGPAKGRMMAPESRDEHPFPPAAEAAPDLIRIETVARSKGYEPIERELPLHYDEG